MRCAAGKRPSGFAWSKSGTMPSSRSSSSWWRRRWICAGRKQGILGGWGPSQLQMTKPQLNLTSAIKGIWRSLHTWEVHVQGCLGLHPPAVPSGAPSPYIGLCLPLCGLGSRQALVMWPQATSSTSLQLSSLSWKRAGRWGGMAT